MPTNANPTAHLAPSTREYLATRLAGQDWVLYNDTNEWLLRRLIRRLGEAQLRSALQVQS